MLLIAIFMPCLSFLLRGKLISTIVSLLIQFTLIGWVVASIWAAFSLSQARNRRRMRNLERRLEKKFSQAILQVN